MFTNQLTWWQSNRFTSMKLTAGWTRPRILSRINIHGYMKLWAISTTLKNQSRYTRIYPYKKARSWATQVRKICMSCNTVSRSTIRIITVKKWNWSGTRIPKLTACRRGIHAWQRVYQTSTKFRYRTQAAIAVAIICSKLKKEEIS